MTLEKRRHILPKRVLLFTVLSTCSLAIIIYVFSADIWTKQKKQETVDVSLHNLKDQDKWSNRNDLKQISNTDTKEIFDINVQGSILNGGDRSGDEAILEIDGKDTIHELVDEHKIHNISQDLQNQRTATSVHGHNSTSPTILLIVANLRTGSTFTASLFTQRERAFYVFEPLHMLDRSASRAQYVSYLNGTRRKFLRRPFSDDSMVVEAMQHWMQCGLSHIDKGSLTDNFHNVYSKSMRPYYLCLKQKVRKIPSPGIAIKECLPMAVNRCYTADVRVYKTIRMRLTAAETLMQSHPNVKVIHLVRDPRGMFYSQLKYGLVKVGHYLNQIQRMCRFIEQDLDVSRRLLLSGNSNFKILRYEDLTSDPVEMAKELYKFTGITMDKYVIDYVNNSTSQNLTDNCSYCTRRANSKDTARKWRTKIGIPLNTVINRHCRSVFAKLGYIEFNSIKTIRDLSVPSTTKETGAEILMGKRV